MSYVVVGILWVWIYNYDWGAANALLRAVGLGSWARPWLGDPNVALPALILVTTWMWSGFNMVVILAGIHSLPSEVLEAAELDNCGWGGKLVHVIVPLLKPTILNLLILSFIGKMKIFDLVWITTKGGPLWATETVSTYVYKRAFEWTTFDLGYPSTVATVWFAIVLTAVLTLTWAFRRRERIEF
jgi:multiple sugar transport system permease protein/raffinose/stachyose/melibiose transport system permease protein